MNRQKDVRRRPHPLTVPFMKSFRARFSVKVVFFIALIVGIAAMNPGRIAYFHSDILALSPIEWHDASTAYDEFDILDGIFGTTDSHVKRNETFSDILSRFNISHATIARLASIARPALDVRKIRAGQPYRVYTDSTDGTARFLVYEQNPVDYVVFELSDSLRVEPGSREVTTVRKEVRGTISSSLYETLAELEVNPMLAIELSEVFAWQVDFYRIMKGDQFSVVYEEKFVGEYSISAGNIQGARFYHAGRDYYAFAHTDDDGRIEFYDEKGNSLRRPFLKAPLKFSRISSRYSLRRFHPVQKRYKAHLGTDYAAPTGTPVRATADGVVLEAGYTKNNGRYVKIKHNSTYTTGYLHFSKIATGIKAGVRISQGDIIGYVGSTGLATGPHLCYRFWKNGKQVDALREKLPDTVEPIDEAYRKEFASTVERLMAEMDT